MYFNTQKPYKNGHFETNLFQWIYLTVFFAWYCVYHFYSTRVRSEPDTQTLNYGYPAEIFILSRDIYVLSSFFPFLLSIFPFLLSIFPFLLSIFPFLRSILPYIRGSGSFRSRIHILIVSFKPGFRIRFSAKFGSRALHLERREIFKIL